MRSLFPISLLIMTLALAHATSYLFTLEQKVDACKVIVKVSVTDVASPQTKSSLKTAICRARVLEILKGPSDLKEVEFRFPAYGNFAPDKLTGMIGKEYYLFLHELPDPEQPQNQRWVFEGPAGIRPIAEVYEEHRFIDGKVITDTYSHSNFVASIRAFVTHKQKQVAVEMK